MTCMPVLVSRATMIAPATSLSDISVIWAPTSRTCREGDEHTLQRRGVRPWELGLLDNLFMAFGPPGAAANTAGGSSCPPSDASDRGVRGNP